MKRKELTESLNIITNGEETSEEQTSKNKENVYQVFVCFETDSKIRPRTGVPVLSLTDGLVHVHRSLGAPYWSTIHLPHSPLNLWRTFSSRKPNFYNPFTPLRVHSGFPRCPLRHFSARIFTLVGTTEFSHPGNHIRSTDFECLECFEVYRIPSQTLVTVLVTRSESPTFSFDTHKKKKEETEGQDLY